jgi:DNA-binding MarR family transcriptional regulator
VVRKTVDLPCFCSNLRRASRAVTRLYAEQIRGAGLGPTQFTLLMAIGGHPRPTQAALTRLLDIDTSTLTRTLARMRGAGLVTTVASDHAARPILRLTPAGRRRYATSRAAWSRAQDRLRAALGPDWGRMQAMLTRLAAVSRAAR